MKVDSVVIWLDSAQVKILLLPIGEFSDKKFEEYLERLKELQKVNLSEFSLHDSDGTRTRRMYFCNY